MDNPTRWRFLLEVFPETETIIMNEVLTGLNPSGDNALTRDIRAAEDVIDPAHTPPLAWFMADLGLTRKASPKPFLIADAELQVLKVAFADAVLAQADTDPYNDDAWDKVADQYDDAWKALREAHRAMRKAAQ